MRCAELERDLEKVVGARAQIDSWLLSLHEVVKGHKERLDELLTTLLPEMVEYARKHTKECVPTVENNP